MEKGKDENLEEHGANKLTREKVFKSTLPRGWAKIVLEEYIDIAGRIGWKGLKKEEYTHNGALLIAVRDILENGSINYDVKDHLSDFRYEESPEIKLRPKDILVSKDGTIGRIGYVETLPHKATVNSSILVVRPCSAILPKFLFYYFRGPKFQEIVRKRITGSTVPHLFQYDIKKFSLEIAPFNEQVRIVARLEKLLASLDSGVGSLLTVKAQLRRYRRAVLKHAFEGKLTEEWREIHKHEIEPAPVLLEHIREERKKKEKGKNKELTSIDASKLPELPESWIWVKLGTICKTTSGGTPSRKNKDYYRGRIPWLKSGELNNQIINSAEEHITDEGLSNSSAKIFPKGTLLIALYGATTGKLGILGLDAATNQAICAIFPYCEISRQFIFWHLTRYRNELLNVRVGGAQPNISQQILKNSLLPLAPLVEQHKIVEEVEQRFSVADEIEKIVEQSLTQAMRLRHCILKTAFEGRLIPRNPTDEPAEKSLERVKKGKEKFRSEEERNKKTESKSKGKQKQSELVNYVK